MQANWSLILNVLLLIGVIVAIGRLMKARKQSLNPEQYQPSLGPVVNSPYDAQPYNDDIIAVRKVNKDVSFDLADEEEPELHLLKNPASRPSQPQLIPQEEIKTDIPAEKSKAPTPGTIMMFLLAKENRQFAGYELLQTVLAAGLRFGEGHLFHRHQSANGQGPVICSLAAATSTGVFDLQNIGAFSVRGLCLFMQTSKNPSIDAERFAIMLETARQLSEGMDAHLLDDQRKPLTDERVARYYRLLNIDQFERDCATA
ncbi:cell division protein ZipA C-terminal FtsZ-binding domain-containing protein [Legionella quateirensis]|uniref:Cell division protein ZipA n=1 Tax=Legionella quateirensis TaxID=45072 RepID=A0A378KQA2_9GAMM|nr:cell division protein ZipA C-terminal FtsZ-binding domain-containing protein [Legionella quateirensis]KTD44709.1 cell division protein ZipA [Legionella quateirensis]STY16773.1 cell division protein ZipA [Legionella quateirensis]